MCNNNNNVRATDDEPRPLNSEKGGFPGNEETPPAYAPGPYSYRASTMHKAPVADLRASIIRIPRA